MSSDEQPNPGAFNFLGASVPRFNPAEPPPYVIISYATNNLERAERGIARLERNVKRRLAQGYLPHDGLSMHLTEKGVHVAQAMIKADALPAPAPIPYRDPYDHPAYRSLSHREGTP